MNLADLLGIVHESINASVARAIAKMPRPQLFPATVITHNQPEGIATVTLDGGSAPTGAQIISNDVVVPGNRVMVLHMPPHGAFIIGKPRNGFGEWQTVVFKNGWGNLAGWPPFGWRTDGEKVEFKGFIAGGTALLPAFTLPGYAAPTARLLVGAVTSAGTTVLDCQVTGDVVPFHGGVGWWATLYNTGFPLATT